MKAVRLYARGDLRVEMIAAPHVLQPDEVLMPLLRPFAPDLIQLWAVSPAVGNVANQGEKTSAQLLHPGLVMGDN